MRNSTKASTLASALAASASTASLPTASAASPIEDVPVPKKKNR